MTRMMSDRKPDLGTSGKKHEIFPSEVHVKHMSSPKGAGHEGLDYPDTEEKVHRDQEHGIKKAMGRKMKTGYRN